jgi:hypothetical protein
MPNEVDEPDSSPVDLVQLRSLREGPLPPAELEDRVIGALRDRGAFARKRRPRDWAWAVAAGIALFAAGWAGGRFQPRESSVDGPRFLMLLERGTTPAHLEADEELRRRREYGGWANGVSGSGHILQAERLTETGNLLAARESDEIRWDLGVGGAQGFFVLTAVDIQHAVEIARSCPHLKYGGRIEIREIGSR